MKITLIAGAILVVLAVAGYVVTTWAIEGIGRLP